MGEQKRTIYQEINKFLGLDAFIGVQNKDFFNQPDVIIKGDSPQDVKRKSLELQQKDYLKSKFYKVQQHGFQKALQYEAQRLPAYVDYEGMEWYPIISAALNLFMEESTTIGDDGKMLHIYSNNERIKNALEDLFYTTININTNLPSWCRAMCKFGDNFTYIYGEKEKGIIFLKQMVNYEIEREDKIEDGRLITRFKQRGTNVYFENIEMAHFRLLGDDKYLPYGSSILNKIRRTWKQLVLGEDSMLTYRILRAGEKRVFKIPVGNMNDDDVEAYIERVVNRFKKVQEINPNNATIDYRFNIMGNDEDYFIPVRSENSGTMIDTLQGAQNLDQIHDIEYLRDNLFMGLEIPRPFLSYQSAGGEGKNMAQFDVRFAKKVNRIQQSLLQELNKIAVIHLYYLGYRGEELTNFKMMLTNPSTQSDILKNELLEAKARVYEAMTKTTEGSIAAMSHYMAKKTILNMSDSQIIQDIKIQRIERAISQELQDTPLIIKNTGIFKDVDDRYGSGEALPLETATSGGTTGAAAAPGAGTTLPGEGSPEQLRPPTANAANQGETFTSPSELPPVQGKTESILGRTENLLNEYINVISNNKEIEEKSKDLILYNQKLNENAFKLIKDNEKINGTEEHNSINFSNYEDSDELYENIMKLREDILKSQLDDLNKTKI